MIKIFPVIFSCGNIYYSTITLCSMVEIFQPAGSISFYTTTSFPYKSIVSGLTSGKRVAYSKYSRLYRNFFIIMLHS